jgi:hypothetical protein
MIQSGEERMFAEIAADRRQAADEQAKRKAERKLRKRHSSKTS